MELIELIRALTALIPEPEEYDVGGATSHAVPLTNVIAATQHRRYQVIGVERVNHKVEIELEWLD